MRVISITLCLLAAYTLKAQKDTVGYINSVDIYYGSKLYTQSFYNQLNSTKDAKFNAPVQTVGIGMSSGAISVRAGHSFFTHAIYNQVIPQSIYLQNNLKGTLTGFVFSAAYGKAIITIAEKFATYLYIGFNTGRLRIYDNELIRQKNPFFSPKIGLQPKIRFGKMALSFIAEYEYDVSKQGWRRTLFSTTNKTTINNFRQSGFTGQVGIGYVFD
jgi:hypothetical protein